MAVQIGRRQRFLGGRKGAPSAHRLVNRAIADLHVVCLGVDRNRLVFRRLPGAIGAPAALLEKIKYRLASDPSIVKAMNGRITDVSLT